jgi:hypothetical protein
VREWILRFESWVFVSDADVQRGGAGIERRINGWPVDKADTRAILRLATQISVGHRWVDEFSTKYELPLWEIEDYADIRGVPTGKDH